MELKDQTLDQLADTANIAQFVSFSPGTVPQLRYSRIAGYPANYGFPDPQQAIATLLNSAPDKSVNVRSYLRHQWKGNPFHYGLTSVSVVMAELIKLAGAGFYTIVNETINVHDGGVSGAHNSDVIEFAPDDTPRCVDKPGVCSLPLSIGRDLLQTVYGTTFQFPEFASSRVEFSLHPLRRGYRRQHVIVWEVEQTTTNSRPVLAPNWPNNFSRFLGDKLFGLLIACSCGFHVPRTTVISRRLPPFSFGISTNTGEHWLRTAPSVQEPGRFSTTRGWLDPFLLVGRDEATAALLEGTDGFPRLASVLAQEGVDAEFAGAMATMDGHQVVIEGVQGFGDSFMLGRASVNPLPNVVHQAVESACRQLWSHIGAVRAEWAYDGANVWILQLHSGGAEQTADIIYPGNPSAWRDFEVRNGLEDLRRLIPEMERSGQGIRLIGDVGILSHFGDLLRLHKVPSRIYREQ